MATPHPPGDGTELGLVQRFADVGGRRVSYLHRGGEPTLLLIPGSHQDYRQFDQVVPRLGPTLGLVLVELPGHRISRMIHQDAGIERFAMDVVAVVEACGLRRYVVGGHSIGGMIAIEVGRLIPPGLAGIISIEGWTHWSVSKVMGGPLIYATLTPDLLAEQERRRQLATGHRSQEERSWLSGLWTRWNGLDTLQHTDLPVLELWGDRGLPPPSREAMQIPDRPNIRLRWIAGASHNLPLERPVELADAIMAWLGELERAAANLHRGR